MNYIEMSDFEINCAVARALAFEPIMFFDVDSSICRGPVWNVASGVTEEGIKVSRGNAFKPCNSWADAGPIIENYRITLDADLDIWFARDDDNVHTDKNPLRAAMIVFLKMQEQSNA